MQRVAKHLYRRGDTYTFRRVIPPYARPAFGGLTEYVRSLGDVGLKEAGHLAAQHRAHCDRLIAAASNKPDPTAKAALLRPFARVPDRDEVDRAVRTWVLDRERDAETAPTASNDVGERVQSWGHYADGVARHMRAGQRDAPLMTRWIAESMVEAQGWIVPADGDLRRFLEERIARGERELAARRKAELNWDDQPQPTHRMFAPEMFEHDRQAAVSPKRGPIPIMEMFDGYKAEQEPAAKTIKKWKVALSSLIDHLGHDDASRVTTDDIVGWKNALLAPAADGQRARGQATVRNGYIGAVKPVFGWAQANKLIEANPVAGVSVKVPRRVRTRTERGFTDAEAKTILTAADAIDWQTDGSFKAFACRWLPWLCAYTGARIGEMAQLRREDVGQNEEGLWFVTITPEAGSTKTGTRPGGTQAARASAGSGWDGGETASAPSPVGPYQMRGMWVELRDLGQGLLSLCQPQGARHLW